MTWQMKSFDGWNRIFEDLKKYGLRPEILIDTRQNKEEDKKEYFTSNEEMDS